MAATFPPFISWCREGHTTSVSQSAEPDFDPGALYTVNALASLRTSAGMCARRSLYLNVSLILCPGTRLISSSCSLPQNGAVRFAGESRIRRLESEFPAEYLAQVTCRTSIWRRVGQRCQQRTMWGGKALQSLVISGIDNKPLKRILLW